jgi:hypothetical protein
LLVIRCKVIDAFEVTKRRFWPCEMFSQKLHPHQSR